MDVDILSKASNNQLDLLFLAVLDNQLDEQVCIHHMHDNHYLDISFALPATNMSVHICMSMISPCVKSKA